MSKRILSGTVISLKMDKSAIVRVGTSMVHSKYGKRFVSHKKYCVHKESSDLKVGANVLIEEAAPMSKTKKWIIKEGVK